VGLEEVGKPRPQRNPLQYSNMPSRLRWKQSTLGSGSNNIPLIKLRGYEYESSTKPPWNSMCET